MTDQAMSPLRRRMIEDMSIRKFAPKTQHDYVQRVKEFAAFLGRSPDTAKSEDVRGFRLDLASRGAAISSATAAASISARNRRATTRTPRPPRSNPHRAGRTAIRPPIAVSSLGGFRTPAARARGNLRTRPASETLHRSGHHGCGGRQIANGEFQLAASAPETCGPRLMNIVRFGKRELRMRPRPRFRH
jgi:Phage integrase, N-terminal SAM-like domain